VSDHPISHILPEQDLSASLEGAGITLRIFNQRSIIHIYRFEKKSPCASLKRHLLDEDAMTRYTFAEKRAETLRKNSAKVAEIAKRALGAVKELSEFESNSYYAPLFEPEEFSFDSAEAALTSVVEKAEEHMEEN